MYLKNKYFLKIYVRDIFFEFLDSFNKKKTKLVGGVEVEQRLPSQTTYQSQETFFFFI